MTCDPWYVRGDRWQVTHNNTHDTWHMSHDTWCVVNIISKLSSLAQTVWDLWWCKYLKEKDQWLSQLMNHKAVCTLYIANIYHHTPILLDPIESLNTGYIVIDSSTPSSQIDPHFPDSTSYEHVQVFTLIWRPPRA